MDFPELLANIKIDFRPNGIDPTAQGMYSVLGLELLLVEDEPDEPPYLLYRDQAVAFCLSDLPECYHATYRIVRKPGRKDLPHARDRLLLLQHVGAYAPTLCREILRQEPWLVEDEHYHRSFILETSGEAFDREVHEFLKTHIRYALTGTIRPQS